MVKKVFKFVLEQKEVNTIKVSRGSEILSMQVQKDDPCLWILVEPNSKDLVERDFVIVPTDGDLPENKAFTFIETFQLYDRDLAFHVFEIFLA